MRLFLKSVPHKIVAILLFFSLIANADNQLLDEKRNFIDSVLSSESMTIDELLDNANIKLTAIPEKELIFEASGFLTGVEGYGLSPEELSGMINGTIDVPAKGVRADLSFTGMITGKINGAFTSTDYLTIFPGGRLELDIISIIETDNDHKISLKAVGTGKRKKGEFVTELKQVGQLRTNKSPFWADKLFIVTSGTYDSETSNLKLKFYGL